MNWKLTQPWIPGDTLTLVSTKNELKGVLRNSSFRLCLCVSTKNELKEPISLINHSLTFNTYQQRMNWKLFLQTTWRSASLRRYQQRMNWKHTLSWRHWSILFLRVSTKNELKGLSRYTTGTPGTGCINKEWIERYPRLISDSGGSYPRVSTKNELKACIIPCPHVLESTVGINKEWIESPFPHLRGLPPR